MNRIDVANFGFANKRDRLLAQRISSFVDDRYNIKKYFQKQLYSVITLTECDYERGCRTLRSNNIHRCKALLVSLFYSNTVREEVEMRVTILYSKHCTNHQRIATEPIKYKGLSDFQSQQKKKHQISNFLFSFCLIYNLGHVNKDQLSVLPQNIITSRLELLCKHRILT